MHEGILKMDQSLSTLDVQLIRALTEVRYNRSFLYDDLKVLNGISKGLKEYFSQSQKDEPNNALVLLNPDRQIISVVRADITNVDMQHPTFNDFEKISAKVMREISKSLDLDDYTRLGTRLLFGKLIPSAEKGQEILKEKFFHNFQSAMEANIQNPQLTFTIQTAVNYFVNVSLRVETNGTLQITPTSVNHSHNNFLVIDLDVYTNTSEKYELFLNNSKEIGLRSLKQILSLLEDKK